MSEIAQKSIYLVFWKISLENLPQGNFSKQLLDTDEAREIIIQARQDQSLTCVTDEDLLAPYRKRELSKHKELCEVLSNHYDISISIEDFMHETEHEGKHFVSALPIQCVAISLNASLLVVNCAYSSPEISKDGPEFKIAPDSVSFHLLEAFG